MPLREDGGTCEGQFNGRNSLLGRERGAEECVQRGKCSVRALSVTVLPRCRRDVLSVELYIYTLQAAITMASVLALHHLSSVG